jgi:LemA protein
MTAFGALIAFIGLLLVGGYLWYAGLIAKRNKAREALSGIDVQLRKRFDLVPNILKIASRFMEHEKELLGEVTALRARAMQSYDAGDAEAVKSHLESAGALHPAMTRLFAVAENYPDLKSQETMVRAQESYEEVEGHIAAARRAYNAAVTNLNNAVEIFPGSIIAAAAGVQSMPFYEETEAAARQPVDAADFLN